MFTGLIQGLGRVAEIAPRRGATRLGIDGPWRADQLVDGESIAVDGVCLTVTARRGERFWMDAVAETLARTTLGRLRPGARVNLERALALGDRLGGHLVQGHVDGVVAVAGVTRRGADCRMALRVPEELRRYVAFKGSVALHGVSLTVAALTADGFEVVLIPETLVRTTLGAVRPGERLNVEVDLLARYLERLAIPGATNPAEGR